MVLSPTFTVKRKLAALASSVSLKDDYSIKQSQKFQMIFVDGLTGNSKSDISSIADSGEQGTLILTTYVSDKIN